ncbi:GGDEF domain-containing protein [Eisenbergiella sp.]|uniref:GGDEF domain-containing protein n=1 Tax=Eisenbergiella sp. TaxID=1924109 RepID=UPI00208715A7|nr:diguanylate cyclase [Eisenbergiella sp.]BDF45525.1 diguanylate cyclase [Lachnospiraceae bacterium]GKH41593.1 diguanylate cyclase [Lachnospiraceae bacterium]
MDNFKTPEEFCRFLWHCYLEQRDMRDLKEVADERLTVIGTGSHEISRNRAEFLEAMDRELEKWDGVFLIEDEWYQATEIRENLYSVIGELKAKENAEDRIIYDFSFRFSVLVEKKEGNWFLLQIHQSMPDVSQGDDEFFPHRLIEQENRIFQEKLTEKTRELEMTNRRFLYELRHDELTGLLKRYCLEEMVEKSMKECGQGTLLMIDIDDFKKVNDTFGHPMGDKVLVALGECLRKNFSQDLAGRIGGDEFILYLACDGKSQDTLRDKLSRLREDWDGVIGKLKLSFPVTFSVGVAHYPFDGDNYRVLWPVADKALYEAKKSGKDKVCFASES